MRALDNYFKNHAYDTRPDSDYDAHELELGREVELEHTDNPIIAGIIAKDHLDEIDDYYSRLRDMEDEAEEESEVEDEDFNNDVDDPGYWDGTSTDECFNQIK